MNWYKRSAKANRRGFSVNDSRDAGPKNSGPVAVITRYGNGVGINFIFEGQRYTCPIYNPPLLQNLQTLISRGDAESIRTKFIPNFQCSPD